LYEGGVKHHDPNTKTFCLNNKSKLLFTPTQYIFIFYFRTRFILILEIQYFSLFFIF
jgi:hypothetical protein